MTNIFISSDLHFFHKNILKYNPNRNYSSISEMNIGIVNNINEDVSTDDTLYLLGDISFGKLDDTLELLDQINCKNIHLIKGNHDPGLLKYQEFRNRFKSVRDTYTLKVNEHRLVLSHFPYRTWDRMHYGWMHCFGHLHSFPAEYYNRSMDVGMDGNNCRVYNVLDIIEKLSKIAILPQDHHNRGL